MNDVRVFMRHIRELGYCAKGVRAWYAAHGLDYSGLVSDGTPVAELLATEDAFALNAVEVAVKESEA